MKFGAVLHRIGSSGGWERKNWTLKGVGCAELCLDGDIVSDVLVEQGRMFVSSGMQGDMVLGGGSGVVQFWNWDGDFSTTF